MKDLRWFLLATLALNLTPGPDMLFVSARSIARGWSAGVVSALGIAVGCAIQALAVALGLARLLAKAPFAFEILRYGGAAYLVYLGVQTLRQHKTSSSQGTETPQDLPRMFFQGMVTNLLNPKIGIFFIAFLPQFIQPGAGGFFFQVLLLGGLFNLSGTLVNVAVAFASGFIGDKIGRGSALRWVSGMVLIALGLLFALPDL